MKYKSVLYQMVFFVLFFGGFYVGHRLNNPFEYWWSFPAFCTWVYTMVIFFVKSAIARMNEPV